MTKISIPNRTGHYELDGFEVDISDRDVIIRSSHAKENKEKTREMEREPEQKSRSKGEPTIGPVTGGILDAVGIKLPHR